MGPNSMSVILIATLVIEEIMDPVASLSSTDETTANINDLPQSLQDAFMELISDPIIEDMLTSFEESTSDVIDMCKNSLEEVEDPTLKAELQEIASTFLQTPATLATQQPVASTSSAQQGGGQHTAGPLYTLTPRESTVNKKFKTSTHSFSLRLNSENLPLENLEQNLEGVFDNVLEDIQGRVGANNGDRLGIRINHPSLNAPIHIPFQRIEAVNGASVISAMDRVSQSQTNFQADGEMEVNILHVENPDSIGHGKGRLSAKKCVTIENVISRKKSIVQIQNKDNLCFSRALVTGLHYLMKPEADASQPEKMEWQRIKHNFSKKHCTKQVHLAKSLHASANIPLGPCKGRETWLKFQHHLRDRAQIKIHVLNNGKPEILFSGYVENDVPPLHLFHHSEHYDLITTVKGFYGSAEYCEVCDKGVNPPVKDHPCWVDFKCKKCLHPGFCQLGGGKGYSCLDCSTWFSGQSCYQKHLTSPSGGGQSACQTRHTCTTCLDVFDPAKDHDCSDVQNTRRRCKVCKQSLNPNHQCFVTPLPKELPNEAVPYVFYDFECMIGLGGEHIPNLCVIHLGCSDCISNQEATLCSSCPWRQHPLAPPMESREIVFSGGETLDSVASWFTSLAANCKFKKVRQEEVEAEKRKKRSSCKVIAIAHNARAYDLHLLLKAVFPKLVAPPSIMMKGQKILQMQLGGLIFKDSLNFITMPLGDFPKTFTLREASKGYFPHLYSISENQTYVGDALPPVEFYDPDGMTELKRRKFMQWYENHKHDHFDYQHELLKYCRSDVDILRRGCGKFREMFVDMNEVDPFLQCITLPNACMTVFRTNFLKEQTIAILPPQGYFPEKNQSVIALQWLAWLQHTNPGMRLQHARTTGGEVKLQCGPHTFSVDGYDIDNKTVYSFLGDYYHGCRKHTASKDVHYSLGTTSHERYEWTMYRLNLIRQHPEVSDVVIMWECDFREMVKNNEQCKDFIDTLSRSGDDEGAFTPILDPRNSFYGGRTNGIILHKQCQEGEEIRYVDVCSLYPSVCKHGKFPSGHPTVLFSPPVDRLFEIHGIIQCRILPPGNLYHPLLPYRAKEKLFFPLCRTCVHSTQDVGPCQHSDSDRSWTGTYATVELHYAVQECGYKVTKIYDAWHFDHFEEYDPKSDESGIFASYIDAFFKMKQESSGYPQECDTPEKKRSYIETIYARTGILLSEEQIEDNPGKRSISKSLLNNLWGKLSQKNENDVTQFVSELRVFYDILQNDNISVKDICIINDNVLLLSFAYTVESVKPHSCSNVAIASWVTAQARLKLYSALRPLGDRALYFDTDSVIYLHRDGEPSPPMGFTLGDWTNELDPGNWITEFISLGPKNYAYHMHHPRLKDGIQTVCKVRGFTLNVRASHHVNLVKMVELVKNEQRANISVPVPYPHRICRRGLKRNAGIFSKSETKRYRFVYTKRRIVPDPLTGELTYTLPFGFKLQ